MSDKTSAGANNQLAIVYVYLYACVNVSVCVRVCVRVYVYVHLPCLVSSCLVSSCLVLSRLVLSCVTLVACFVFFIVALSRVSGVVSLCLSVVLSVVSWLWVSVSSLVFPCTCVCQLFRLSVLCWCVCCRGERERRGVCIERVSRSSAERIVVCCMELFCVIIRHLLYH